MSPDSLLRYCRTHMPADRACVSIKRVAAASTIAHVIVHVPAARDMKVLLCLCLLLLLAGCRAPPAVTIAGADPLRGKEAIRRHACVACHTIPGIAGPGSNVGPPLKAIAKRAYIGGVVPNLPSEMVRWLLDPPQIDPRTAMPNMGVTEAEARDIAAYLYTLE